MENLLKAIKCCLELISQRLENDFKNRKTQVDALAINHKRIRLSSHKDTSSPADENSQSKSKNSEPSQEAKIDDFSPSQAMSLEEDRELKMKMAELNQDAEMSPWEMLLFEETIKGFFSCSKKAAYLTKCHALLQSLWQRLHTGHWSKVPTSCRTFYSYGSLVLVGLLLQDLIADLQKKSESIEILWNKALLVLRTCDRGLLMGRPLENNPLHKVASHLQRALRESSMRFNLSEIPHPLPLHVDKIPEEATFLKNLTPILSARLPPLNNFLLNHMKNNLPLKILDLASSWPAFSKWDFNYFRKIAGFRTVPVEVGSRYSDSDWSQELTSVDDFINTIVKEGNTSSDRTKIVYLAQHQLLDQIPELLEDIIVPDYCHLGESDPNINIWMGPKGTVTPIHHDPDHNILVQIHGYKALLIFPEKESKNLYVYEDQLLNNTSRVNLEEESSSKDLFQCYPLLKNVEGHYLILGPGEALYLPPKYWHYVRSLSNSISISFWWK